MKIKVISLFVIPTLALSTGAFALDSNCPAPNQITIHSMPRSVNAYYAATVNGIYYGGYDAAGLAVLSNSGEQQSKPFDLSFLYADIKPTSNSGSQSSKQPDEIRCYYGKKINGYPVGIILYAGKGSQKIYSAKFIETSANTQTCEVNSGSPTDCSFNAKL